MFASIPCDVLTWLGGAAVWTFSNLGAPILTGAVAGLVVPLALRWESTPAEIRQHNREAQDLNDDFRRFMTDLSRDVKEAFRKCEGEKFSEDVTAGRVVIRQEAEGDGSTKLVAKTVEREEEPEFVEALTESRKITGWLKEVQAAMHDALWRYRDEAIRKRGQFIQLVEAEGKRHERRRKKLDSFPALQLSGEAREALVSWRRHPNPFRESGDDILVWEDLTAMEISLVPLETELGFTWEAAKQAILDAAK